MKPALVVALLLTGCLSAWSSSGPWACDQGADAGPSCANDLVCDDGVCCSANGGTPACPTLPSNGRCADDTAPVTLYPDGDGDGAGDSRRPRPFCASPVNERWVARGDDCNDTDVTVSPTATERCNGLDDDCDGVIDNGTERTTWYQDLDGDGAGQDCDGGCTLLACAQPHGYAAHAGDCAPNDPARFPGAPERCNGVDDNCNGIADDPPFADVENPGLDAGRHFDCAAPGQKGVCAQGGLQCVFDPVTSKFQPTCVPRLAPQPELCGDGVDNDCDGFIDNPPGCGGPASLINAPGTRIAAMRLDLPDAGTPSGLPAHCLGDEPGARAMAWLNPSWVGSGGTARHLWVQRAPPTLSWDLSGPRASLVLGLTLPFFVHPADNGWGDGSFFQNPVVTLCGQRVGEYVRLFPLPSTFNTAIGAGFNVTLPLSSPKAGWQVETGPLALDRRHVTALELVVSPLHPTDGGTVTFTLVFSPDAGFAN
jgi:hypothetical protein